MPGSLPREEDPNERTPMKLAVLALALFLATPAYATWTLDFIVQADPLDPLYAGQTSHGTAVFDTDPYISYFVNANPPAPILESLSFDWAGTHWDTANAGMWWSPAGISYPGEVGFGGTKDNPFGSP